MADTKQTRASAQLRIPDDLRGVPDEEQYQREVNRMCGDDFNVQAGFQRAWLLRDAEIASLREKLATAEARVAILDAQEVELPASAVEEGRLDGEYQTGKEYLDDRVAELELQLLDALRAVRACREVARDLREVVVRPHSRKMRTAAIAAYDALAGKEGE